VEEILCPFCNLNKTKPLWKSKDFTYVKCKNCGLVYQNPRYEFSYLCKNVYTEKYFLYELRNEENFYNLMLLNIRDSDFRLFSERFKKKKRFLDIGCATGRLLKKLREEGWSVTGVELCPQSVSYARKKYKLKVYNSTLEKVRFPSASFEAVHLSHVIEHLPEPIKTLCEIKRILVPQGLFLCVTPNVDGFQAKLFKDKWRSSHRDHLTLFSTVTLKKMLEYTGFRILKQFSYGGLAAGLGPLWLKKILDKLAKKFNFGDVTAFLCEKKSL